MTLHWRRTHYADHHYLQWLLAQYLLQYNKIRSLAIAPSSLTYFDVDQSTIDRATWTATIVVTADGWRPAVRKNVLLILNSYHLSSESSLKLTQWRLVARELALADTTVTFYPHRYRSKLLTAQLLKNLLVYGQEKWTTSRKYKCWWNLSVPR